MKHLRSFFSIIIFFSFAIINQVSAQSGQQLKMFNESESSANFNETVKIFKEEVSANGWSILNVTNMAGILSEKGYTLEPVLIFDVCSGKYSAKILAKDKYRFVSAIMPCRVSIYKTSDNKVVIGRMNAKDLAPMFGGELADVMQKSSAEIETIIAKTISKTKSVSGKSKS